MTALDSYAEYRGRKQFGSIDGLRCFSVMAVLWHHAPGSLATPLLERGHLGVPMFFVISGYLIVTLLLRERDRNGRISLRQFYARRALRIFPVYYAVLLAMTVALGVIAPGSKAAGPFFENLPYYVTYTSNFIVDTTILAITWSLSTEEQFYCAWPALEKVAGGRRMMWVATALVLTLFALSGPLSGVLGLGTAASGLIEKLDYMFSPICVGVALAHLLHERSTFTWMSRYLNRNLAPVVAIAVVIATASLPGRFEADRRLIVNLAFAALLASVVVREDSVVAPLLRWRWVARIGVISYGMYLFHKFALDVAMRALGPAKSTQPWALFFLTTILTILIAELSYRFFETPFLRLKHRFRARAPESDLPARPDPACALIEPRYGGQGE